MRTCGFENEINLYLDGELSGQKLRAFEAHLEDCPECRSEVEQYRGLLEELHGLPEPEVPPMLEARLHDALAKETEKGDGRVKRKFNPWALSAVAAAVMVLFGGIALIGSGALHGSTISNDDMLQSKSYARNAAATAAPPAAPSFGGEGLMAEEPPMPAPTMAPAAMEDKAGSESFTAGNGAVEKPADANADVAKADNSNPPQQENGRKIIYTAYVVVQTRDYNNRLATVQGLVAKYGGYKANSQENGAPDPSDPSAARSAVFSLRIPLDKYADAMNDLKAMGTDVISNSENTQDVSRQYVDTEARTKTLKAERDRLYELLAKADTMESIIALQSRITDLTTQIEQDTAQLNFWDDQVSFSTITVELHEVVTPKKVTPVDPDLGTRANGALNTTLNDMRKGLENFAVGFVGFLPWLAVIAVIAAVVAAIALPAAAKARRAARKRAAADPKKEE